MTNKHIAVLERQKRSSYVSAVKPNTLAVTSKPREGISPKERVRRRLVRLVFLVYWLLIFEGVLRKWVWPQYAQYLYFIRDPFVLYIYFVALANGMWPRSRPLLLFAYLISLLAIVWIVIQLLLGSSGRIMMLLAVYGWRNYFLYIPLAFLIGEQFRWEDIYRLFRQTLIVIIPMAFLIAVQFASSPDSIINAGIASDESLQFRGLRGSLGHIRPNGTFTAAVGPWHLVASSLCMALVLWLVPAKQRPISNIMLAFGAVATLTCLAFSINRGMFIHSGIVVLSCLVAGVVLRGRVSRRAIVLPILLVICVVTLYPVVYPEAFAAFIARWFEGVASESRMFGHFGVFGRALYEVYDFLRLVGQVPLFGYGMGLAGNAGTILGVTVAGTIPLRLAETDWSRHFVDMGPMLAVLFILFRVMLTIVLGTKSLWAARRSGNPMPVLLFGYVGVVIFYGQISGHGTICGYAWLFAGLLMASINLCRFGVRENQQ